MLKYTSIIKRAEKLGWHCNLYGQYIEFSQHSPAGEDFSFTASGNTIGEMKASIRGYVEDFDTEEHIAMWVIAKQEGTAGVPTIRELVEDADAIQAMLNELVRTVA